MMLADKVKNSLPDPARQLVRQLRRGLNHLKLVAPNLLARTNRRPVFVLGNQKSGTSVIASLLGSCTGLPVTIDLRREIGRQFYLDVADGKVPFRKLIARNKKDFSRDIIKEPTLSLFYPELREYFPDARCVMIVRDPRDNIRSILNRLNVPGNLDTLDHRAEYNIDPGFEVVLSSRWPGIKAMPHYIEQLAERWNHICDVYLENKDEMILVRYEDFNKDKEQTIVRLAEKLGLQPDFPISDKVDRQHQSRGDRGIQPAEFFGERNLSRIETLCSSRMRLLGYS